jgi:hypothetical protein
LLHKSKIHSREHRSHRGAKRAFLLFLGALGVQTATNGLNVKIVQVTGDEASGITKFATELLGAQKASDLFHVQQDITRGLTSVLARRVQQAEAAVQVASEEKKVQLEKLKTLAQNTSATIDAPTPQFVKIGTQLLKEDRNEQKCQQQLDEVKRDYKAAQDARRTITGCYHPYDLVTGDKRPSERLKKELEAAHAAVFQRSSSCVEGRNGVLSLKHHALHKLNVNKLQAQRYCTIFFPRVCSDN